MKDHFKDFDRRAFITGLGGMAAVGLMSHEARADALEEAMEEQLNQRIAAARASGNGYPTVAELEQRVATRAFRAGTGAILYPARGSETVDILPKMPDKPTLKDFFELRFQRTRNHVMQSAAQAMSRGVDEEVVLACLLHDVVQELMRADHGYWGAQLFEPYVPEITSFAIKYHQALRFYPDEEYGYNYPDFYYNIFGVDYEPVPHIQEAEKFVRDHKWYYAPREVTVSDLYAFDENAVVHFEQFEDIVGRHFKQPKEGLGNDNSPVAHMWRTLINPDAPL